MAIPLSKQWQAWVKDPAAALDDLCDRIEGGESQTAISRSLDAGVATLSRWIAENAERSARVREARLSAARAYADEALHGIKTASDPFELAKAREAAHHLRWLSAKANPGVYGEKIDHNHSGGVNVTITPVENDL